jgi:hypothetical protein
MNQSSALERRDMMVEPRGGFSEQLGDALRRFRALGEELHYAKAQRMRERAQLGDVRLEVRGADGGRGTWFGHETV